MNITEQNILDQDNDSNLFTEEDERFMDMALRQAEIAYDAGEVPIGCIIVDKDQKVIGRGYNQMESLQDATAHSEIIAIGAASNSLENWRLDNCTLYVTLEPCPMCAGAILNSRISRVVYGSPDNRLGACGTTMDVLSDNPINRKLLVNGGLKSDFCLGLIQDFFIDLRNRKKK